MALCVFSSCLLKFLLYSALPSSVSSLTTNALNSLSSKLFISISFIVFQGLSPALSVEIYLSFFILLMIVSLSL